MRSLRREMQEVQTMSRAVKPLKKKAYFHIPHLPNSRLGLGDHHCSEGQARIATLKPRDKNDLIIVQEKLDGSCVSVAKIEGVCYALSKSGYLVSDSPHLQHRIFDRWVQENYNRFDSVLKNDERICGEWLIQAHGTRYSLKHEPFVAFDILGSEQGQLAYSDFVDRVGMIFVTPCLIHIGTPISVQDALRILGIHGHHGAVDEAEGLIYRVERQGKVDFICKYVKPDKKVGCYLESETHGEPVWNISPDKWGVFA